MRHLLILLSSLLLSCQLFAAGSIVSVSGFYKKGNVYQGSEVSLTVLEHFIPSRARILVSYKSEKLGIIDPSGLKGNDYCHDFVTYFEGEVQKNSELLITMNLLKNRTSNHEGLDLPTVSGFTSLVIK